MERLRILTWHVHGSYLDSLVRTGHEFFLPIAPGRPEGYGGRGAWPWPADRVHEVPADDVQALDVDAVLFQSARNWRDDGPRILSDAQQRGPRVYVEHDPPRDHPTDTRHPVDDPSVLLVQVTAFNDLMWDPGRTPTRVIEHGVPEPVGIRYGGELERGLVVVNNLATRGRRLGLDVFLRARSAVPLDLAGMDSTALDGIGEVRRDELPAFSAAYRFFFHPIRYTSFGMAVCEAMMVGLPVVALATTEMPTVIENGRSGLVDTSVDRLIDGMRTLLREPGLARELGDAGRAIARERFSMGRFEREWTAAFRDAMELAGGSPGGLRAGTPAADPAPLAAPAGRGGA
jgi:hypothetical protein